MKEPRLIEAANALSAMTQVEVTGAMARAELVKRIDVLMGFMTDEGNGRAA